MARSRVTAILVAFLALLSMGCDKQGCTNNVSLQPTSTPTVHYVSADGNYTYPGGGSVESPSKYERNAQAGNFGKWLDTGESVTKNTKITLYTYGQVFLRSSKASYTIPSWTTSPIPSSTPITAPGKTTIAPRSPFEVKADDRVYIVMDNPTIGPPASNLISISSDDCDTERHSCDYGPPQRNKTTDKPIDYLLLAKGEGLNILYNNSPILQYATKSLQKNSPSDPGYAVHYTNNMPENLQLGTDLLTKMGALFVAPSDGNLSFQFYTNAPQSTGSYDIDLYNIGAPIMDGKNLEILIASENPNSKMTSNDGIYEAVPSNLSAGYILVDRDLYNFTSTLSGKVYMRIKDDNYIDNPYGYYVVEMQTNAVSTVSSKILNAIINPIKSSLKQAVRKIYQTITLDYGFQKAIKGSITLYVVIYAIMFTFSMIEDTLRDVVLRLIKISIMMALISPSSWIFFYNHLFILFDQGVDQLISIATGDSEYNGNSFSFFDNTMDTFFSKDTWKQIGAVIVSSFIGPAVVALFIYAAICFILTFLQAVLGYIMALIGIAMLMALAPIFIPFMLFKPTAKLFESWLRYIFYFSLSPALLFITLIILNELVLLTLYDLLNFKACWAEIFSLGIYISDLSIDIDILPIYFLQVSSVGPSNLNVNNLSDIFTTGMTSNNQNAPAVVLEHIQAGIFLMASGIFSYLHSLISVLVVKVLVFFLFIKMMENSLELAPQIAMFLTSTQGRQAKLTGSGSGVESALNGVKKFFTRPKG